MLGNIFQTVHKKVYQLWSLEITRIVLVTIAAHSSSIFVGMTQGYSAILLPQLSEANSSLPVTEEESSWIASLGVISTPFGALFSGILVDILGRKSTIIIVSIPFFIGWIVIALATNVSLLYVGRTMSAFASGMTAVNYLYVAEVSRKEHRSVLSAFGPILASLGVLIVYTMGSLMTWEKTAFVSSAFSALTVFVMMKVPESPAWYVSKKQFDKAYKSLCWLRGDVKKAEIDLKALTVGKIDTEKINESDKSNKRTSLGGIKHILNFVKSPTVYKPFFILLFFFAFQSGSGIYVILFYATQIFHQFDTKYDEHLITVTIGLFRFIMAIVGALLMAKIGRRPLAMFSGASMSLALIGLCGYESMVTAMSATYQFLPLISILCHVGFSMIGFLQLPWILTSELFPLRYRGLFSGVVSAFAYLFIFISVKIYSNLLRILTLGGLLWGFFIMSSVGTLFIYFFLPETKDKSLKEISGNFEKKKKETNEDLKQVISTVNIKEVSITSNNSEKLNREISFDVPIDTIRI